jgi:ribosomal protein L7/L12
MQGCPMSDIDHGARVRLDYIEQQLEALFPGRYVPFATATATGMPPAVVELARAGKTIAAIQEYRSITGAGLAEAKLAVESIR